MTEALVINNEQVIEFCHSVGLRFCVLDYTKEYLHRHLGRASAYCCLRASARMLLAMLLPAPLMQATKVYHAADLRGVHDTAAL